MTTSRHQPKMRNICHHLQIKVLLSVQRNGGEFVDSTNPPPLLP